MPRLRRLRFLAVGSAIVGVAVLCALAAPLLAPGDPYRQAVGNRLLPPVWAAGGSWTHALGTDPLGRDTLSRIIYGARVSISAGAALGPGFGNMIVVLGLTGWPIYTRVVRAETLKFREREFVLAARALGLGSGRILRAHVLPNLVNTIIVMASLEVARMIILESFLSFLGLGIQPPTPSWGAMLGEGRVYMLTHWWLAAFPGAAIFVTTLGINLFGDGLRDVLDPHRVLMQPGTRAE